MAMERPSPRGFDTRSETLDEPTGTIEFGPPRVSPPGEDLKPGSSSYIGGTENAAVRKAEQRRPTSRRGWRGLWKRIRDRIV